MGSKGVSSPSGSGRLHAVRKAPVKEQHHTALVSSSGRSQQAVLSFSTETMSKSQQREKRSLLNLCLGVLGRHLEDILDELDSIAPFLPASLKMTLLAIARRRGLVRDDVVTALADESWETLDVSGADVTDLGMERASENCSSLKSVDISRCSSLTASSVQALVRNCPMIQTIRCGGTALSNAAAKESLQFILPGLKVEVEAEDSWENLESKQVGRGAQALRWLVWPTIDEDSHKQLMVECPKVVVNPAVSAPWHRSRNIPQEAFPDVALDSPAIMGIDPKTWAEKGHTQRVSNFSSLDMKLSGLSIAERFKLAFVERDERLASKRAKNLRQNQRRAEKAWLDSDTDAKAMFWAGVTQKSLKK